MHEQAQSQLLLQQQQSHQIQQQSQPSQQRQQQPQQLQQPNQHVQQQSQSIQQQQLPQQMQQGQSIQQNPQLQQQSQQSQQQLGAEVALSAPLGTMSVQVAPQSTITAMPPGSVAIQLPQSVSSISQSGLQQQSGTTTITTMSALQQQQPLTTDWTQGRVQVIQQQPLQNTAYLQQLYNPQSQLLVPGNLALHSAGVSPGSIQVIAAGKSFQQAGPHILTQGKQVITAQSQTASFPGYTTIPTTNSQTLVIGQLGVISSQPSILSAQAASGQTKQDLQKFTASCSRAGTVQSSQAMQFSPWQFGTTSLPQNIWAASSQQPALLATQNSIFIRGATSQDTAQSQQQAQHMFIQSPPPQQLQHHTQGVVSQTTGMVSNLTPISQHDVTISTSIAGIVGKPRGSEIMQPKANMVTNAGRPPLLPSASLRPASSVSTQTAGTNQVAQSMQQKSQSKLRVKSVVGRGVGVKTDTINLNKIGIPPLATNKVTLMSPGNLVSGTQTNVTLQQQHLPSSQQQPVHQQINVQQQQQISLQQQQAVQSTPSQIARIPSAPSQQPLAVPQQIQAVAPSQQQIVSDRPVVPVLSMDILQNHQTPSPNQSSLPTSASSPAIPPQLQSSIPLAPSQVASLVQVTPVQGVVPDSAVSNLSEVGMKKMETSSESEKIGVITNQQVTQSGDGEKDSSLIMSRNAKSATQNSANVNDIPKTTISKDAKIPGDDTKERSAVPKALVKPQHTNVLTHVIEGFVIQEAAEPFPVNNSLSFTDNILDASAEKRMKFSLDDYNTVTKPDQVGPQNDYGSCELCGKVDLKTTFKRSKRFCSLQCSMRFSIKGKRETDSKSTESDAEWDKQMEKNTSDLGSSEPESSLSPLRNSDSGHLLGTNNSSVLDSTEAPKVNPSKWTVSEVCDFIRSLPGCWEYAEDFANQEIDGQALMLLREDHLMSAMSMKLGPALKIVAKIDLLRETKNEQQMSSLEK